MDAIQHTKVTEGDVYTAADRYRTNLDNKVDGYVMDAVDKYDGIMSSLDKELNAVGRLIKERQDAGLPVPASWLHKQSRYIDLIDQTHAKINDYSRVLQQDVSRASVKTFKQAERDSLALIDRSLPGYQERIRPFNTLPSGAAEQYMGTVYSARTSPLPSVFASMGPTAGATLDSEILNGIAMGLHPLEVVKRAKDRLKEGQQGRAATIARTEMYRSYREANRRTFDENKDVVDKWIWNAHIGDFTCAVCFAMHGEEFDTDEPMGSHPNCRCTQIPKTKTWAELGFPEMDEYDEPLLGNEGYWQNGEFIKTRLGAGIRPGAARFHELPEAKQRAILGPKKFAAYKRGDIELADVVNKRQSHKWGTTRTVASYDQALLNAQARQTRQQYDAVQAQIRQSQIDAAMKASPDSPDWVKEIDRIKAESIAVHGRVTEEATRTIGKTIRQANNDFGLPPGWEDAGQRLKENRRELKKLERSLALQKRKMGVREDFDFASIGDDGRYVNDYGNNEFLSETARKKYTKLQDDIILKKVRMNQDKDLLYTPRFSDPDTVKRFKLLQQEQETIARAQRGNQTYQQYMDNANRMKAVKKEMGDLLDSEGDAFLNSTDSIVDTIRQIRSVGTGGKKHGYVRHRRHADEATEAFEDALEVYPSDWVDESVNHGPLSIGKTDRGYYDPWQTVPEVLTSGTGKASVTDTMVHEFGHRMEHINPEIKRLEKEFYNRRTVGEKTVKMKTLFPNSGYSPNEITRVDDFHTPYVGKDYSGHFYEVLSMGGQELLNPRTIRTAMLDRGTTPHVVEDAELVDFIVGLLGGM